MTKRVFPLLVLGACTGPVGKPASLVDLRVAIVKIANDVEVTLAPADTVRPDLGEQCPLLGEDLQGTYDGQPLRVEERGGDEPGAVTDACNQIFLMADLSTTSADPALVVVSDSSATWTMSVPTRNDFVPDDRARPTQVVWQSATEVSEARLWIDTPTEIRYPTTTSHGNVIDVPALGANEHLTGVEAIDTSAYCTGPATCRVERPGHRDFVVNP